MAAAGIMLSYQTAGKAARDALFLAHYPVDRLPAIVIAAALLAIGLGLLFSRWLESRGPNYVIPRSYLVSGLLTVIEWLLFDAFPLWIAPLIYLHIVGLGAILLSGFWSMVSEEIPPRDAKKIFGQIAGMGTLGGILGGIAAERIGAWFTPSSVLIQLGATHLVMACVLTYLARLTNPAPQSAPAPKISPWETFSKIPYLGALGLLVLLGTSSAAAIDFIFKAQATQTFGKGPELLRFFAAFHTASAVLTFLLQSFLLRVSFEKLGLTRTVGSLPAIVGAGSLASLAFPFFPVTSLTRMLEFVFRGSLFRSGYELFYTPIPPAEKRAVKSMIDVGCDRLGDAVGSAIVQTALIAAPAAFRNVILGITAISAAISLWIASRLDAAYKDVVKRGLLDRAGQFDLVYVEDITTLSAVLQSVSSIPALPAPSRQLDPLAEADSPSTDPPLEMLAHLRSGDLPRVQAALQRIREIDPLLVPQLVRLLAWNDTSLLARDLLAKAAPLHTGALVDALLDKTQEFAIRRRLPRILAACATQRAADGLVEALEDSRFEVRFQSGRALDFLSSHHPALRIDPARIHAAVTRELSVNRTIWNSRRLLDERDSADDFSYLDDALRERAHQSLEHVFSLFAVILPREPLRIIFRALHSPDVPLRQLAIEYMESITPANLWPPLAAILEGHTPEPIENPTAALSELLLSNQSLLLALKSKL